KPGRATRKPRLAATKSARRLMTATGGELSLSSGAELLAATRAAGAEHLAAARGGLAGEEPVPAGADEVARLESALHRRNPESTKRAASRGGLSGRAVRRATEPSQGMQDVGRCQERPKRMHPGSTCHSVAVSNAAGGSAWSHWFRQSLIWGSKRGPSRSNARLRPG